MKTLIMLLLVLGSTLLFSCKNDSKQSSTSQAKTEQVSWKGNEDYRGGYKHGKRGRILGATSAAEYCREIRARALDATVPITPSKAWEAGFNDGFNGKESQY